MREYRIEAQGWKDRERFLVITTSRDRALHFAGVFMANTEIYSQVSVEVLGRIWLGAKIGEIP